MYVLRATYGPPNMKIDELYAESPLQTNYIVRVKFTESAKRLMQVGYELIEDPHGDIDPSKKHLTPDDVAGLLGIARSTVYKYLGNGKLPAEKDEAGKYRIPQSAVNQLKVMLLEQD